LRSVAVTHTYPAAELGQAHLVVDTLSDLDRVGRSDNLARRVLSQYMKDYEHRVRRTAMFSSNVKTRVLAKIVSTMARRRNFAVFETREEALAWLTQGTPRR